MAEVNHSVLLGESEMRECDQREADKLCLKKLEGDRLPSTLQNIFVYKIFQCTLLTIVNLVKVSSLLSGRRTARFAAAMGA